MESSQRRKEKATLEVKTLFSGWTETDLIHVKKLVDVIWKGAAAMNEAKKIEYINSRLKGIVFKGYKDGKPILEREPAEKECTK